MMPIWGRFSFANSRDDSDSNSSSSTTIEYEDSSAVQEGGDSEDFAGGDTPDYDE